jgi:hypothetical protein
MSFLDGLGKLAGDLLGFAIHPGSILETLADGLGLPDVVGKALAIGGDIFTQDYAAAARDGVGLLTSPRDSSPKDVDVALQTLLKPKNGSSKIGPPTTNPGKAMAPEGKVVPTAPTGTDPGTAPAAQPGDAVAKFLALPDEELIRAIEENRIPPEVLKDQGSLLVLQQRLYSYNQALSLVTNILRSAHEMRMEIIHQVRA